MATTCKHVDQIYQVAPSGKGCKEPLAEGALDGTIVTCPWHGC